MSELIDNNTYFDEKIPNIIHDSPAPVSRADIRWALLMSSLSMQQDDEIRYETTIMLPNKLHTVWKMINWVQYVVVWVKE